VTGGINSTYVAAWLANAPNARQIGDLVVPWRRNAPARAHTVLAIEGAPLETDDLWARVGTDYARGTVENALRTDDRFIRITPTRWALRAWGLREYRPPRELLAEALTQRGGAADFDALVAELVAAEGADESSLRWLAKDATFVTLNDGIIRLASGRSMPDPDRFAPAAELSPRIFRMPGRWAYCLVVDEDGLRGSGRLIGNAFPHVVGMLPGDEMRWEPPEGPFGISWGRQPALSSHRSAALSFGARPGDLLFLAVDDEGEGSWHHVAREQLDRAMSDPAQELRLRVGSTARDERGHRELIGHALGFSDRPRPTWLMIEKRFRDRAEPQLAELAVRARAIEEGG